MLFQYLGLLNTTDGVGVASNHILVVELDKVLNYEFGDINNNHVVDSLQSVAAATTTLPPATAGYYDAAAGDGSVFRDLSLFSHEAMQVWVDYDGPSTVLDVTLAPIVLPRPKKPLLSRDVDLAPPPLI